MIALLDGDLFAYRCAASAENEATEEVAILRCDKWLRETLQETGAEEYGTFLTGKNNFRKILYPLYKANRTQPKPKYLEAVRQFLKEEWSAVESTVAEADDILGMNQHNRSVIVSNDKDLLQIPGLHYNPVKKEFTEVGEYEGQWNFWLQMLSGDKSDNVPGFDGTARASFPKFIVKLLSDMEDFEQEVFDLYEDKAQFLINFNLLHIWRKEHDYKCPQVIHEYLTGKGSYKPEQEVQSVSLDMIMALVSQLSDLGNVLKQESGSFAPGDLMEGT